MHLQQICHIIWHTEGPLLLTKQPLTKQYLECREICMLSHEEIKQIIGKIGGGRRTKIDECKTGRQKYHRGRLVEWTWILVMIKLEGGYRFEICPDNKKDKNTLRYLILKNVVDGFTIMTDC